LVAPVGWRLKRLQYLAQRVAGSLAQRGWRGTLARVRAEFRHVSASTDAALAFEPVGSLSPPASLPCAPAPEVTVIVPVHGQFAWTLACLRSIARHGAEVPFEVIVVDDASPDDDASRLAGIAGLRLLRNPRNLGFVGSCNAGAAAAQGRLLYFLNNDTQVTPGWLDRLCEAFREVPGCGIVGSRLVYPDGRLQEAGGLVYTDAQAWNVGRFEQRNDPRYLYRREVDYVSGASLLIEAALFRDIGGFDPRYAPAYCEDMDLAFAVRARGRKVIYEPASVVIHDEGTSSGTGPFAGVKRHQEINRVKFAAKWADALRAQPAPRTPVEQAIHRGHPHVLVMDALMPDPTRDAGSMQTIGLLRLLRELGWRVSFMADNRRATPEDILRLGRLGVETLCMPWSPDLPTWLRREGKGLGAILVSRYYVAAPYLRLFRRYTPQAKVLLELADMHFLREQRAAEHTGDAMLARQAKETRRRELGTVAASDVTLVVSTAEQQLLAQELPQARVVLVPNMHEVHGRHTPFARRDGLLFVGGFGHPPNADAARWLAAEIYPRIRARRPDIALHLVGDIPDGARRELEGSGVVVHGRVPDLLPMLEARRVALAPLRYGAGVKGKVNVAMSHGLPVVATSLAAEGMWLRDGDNALLADDAEAFATAVLRLYDDEALWTRLSDAGLENVRRHFSIDVARSALASALG
jgi:GT2 family glycosyltransferase